MAANFVKKIFRQDKSTDEGHDGSKEEEEGGGGRSTRFAEPDPGAGAGRKKGGKKEVRVQEPASEDGEQQKAKATSIKKAAEKKGPPSVSHLEYHILTVGDACVCMCVRGCVLRMLRRRLVNVKTRSLQFWI